MSSASNKELPLGSPEATSTPSTATTSAQPTPVLQQPSPEIGTARHATISSSKEDTLLETQIQQAIEHTMRKDGDWESSSPTDSQSEQDVMCIEKDKEAELDPFDDGLDSLLGAMDMSIVPKALVKATPTCTGSQSEQDEMCPEKDKVAKLDPFDDGLDSLLGEMEMSITPKVSVKATPTCIGPNSLTLRPSNQVKQGPSSESHGEMSLQIF